MRRDPLEPDPYADPWGSSDYLYQPVSPPEYVTRWSQDVTINGKVIEKLLLAARMAKSFLECEGNLDCMPEELSRQLAMAAVAYRVFDNRECLVKWLDDTTADAERPLAEYFNCAPADLIGWSK